MPLVHCIESQKKEKPVALADSSFYFSPASLKDGVGSGKPSLDGAILSEIPIPGSSFHRVSGLVQSSQHDKKG
jgi:hypothetical protein